MEKATYPILYNREHYTVMANDIIRGKQDMTLQESKILRLLITQVVKEDKDLKTYTCKIADLAAFLDIPRNNLYRDVRSICDNLMQRVIRVGTKDPKRPWKMYHWVSSAEYDGRSTLTLCLSDEIKPYVCELEEYFTQYQLVNILEMSSYYAVRLYELLKSDECKVREDDNRLAYSMDYLRQYFCCENKYKNFSQFKEKVLQTGVREINQKTDLTVGEMTFAKTGKRITGVVFELLRTQPAAV